MTPPPALTALPLEPGHYLPHLRRDTAAFERSLRDGDLGAPVPACPGWSLRDLGEHLAHVHRWAATVVRTGELCREKFAPEPGTALADWYAHGAKDLLAVLDDADPDAPCWNFGEGTRVAAFWYRRQAQETAVHLVDAQQAAGPLGSGGPASQADPLDALLAADGVDEVLTVMLPRLIQRGFPPPPLAAPLRFQTADTGHTWTLAPPADGEGAPYLSSGRGSSSGGDGETGAAAPAATVTAPAAELFLLLWSRRSLPEADLAITGEEAVATRFLAAQITP